MSEQWQMMIIELRMGIRCALECLPYQFNVSVQHITPKDEEWDQ